MCASAAERWEPVGEGPDDACHELCDTWNSFVRAFCVLLDDPDEVEQMLSLCVDVRELPIGTVRRQSPPELPPPSVTAEESQSSMRLHATEGRDAR